MKKTYVVLAVIALLGMIQGAAAQAQSNCCSDAGGSHMGCDDPECEGIVCGMDPFCCQVNWDSICISEAEQYCSVCSETTTTVPETTTTVLETTTSVPEATTTIPGVPEFPSAAVPFAALFAAVGLAVLSLKRK